MSAGYGFGAWNGSGAAGIENGLHYDYANIAYFYEKELAPKFALVLEPYCNIINKPRGGIDIGFTINLRTYLFDVAPDRRFYVTFGGGTAYTSIKFTEQGTHGLFVAHGAVGYRHGRFFIENRFHHYSNGDFSKPNRSVNSSIVKVGYYF